MILVALAIYIDDGGPVLFMQNRLGWGGRTFRCFKFRSMVPNAEQQLDELLSLNPSAFAEWERTHKLQKDPRITGVGRLLRKLSADELPQLVNVLAGDMSLVGPRPIVESEALRYGRWFGRYCSVRPGLTGLWQVRRGQSPDYRRRVALDVLYVRQKSLALDLGILVATIPAVLFSRGAY